MLLTKGTRVLIKTPYKYDLSGFVGTVTGYLSNDYDSVPVEIPGKKNPRSSKGVFWYPRNCLEIIQEGTIEEEIFMLPGYKIAYVHFPDDEREDRSYPYALYDDGTYTTGDDVVVKTGHHGMSVAKIAGIQDYQPDLVKHDRQIVCRLDFTAYRSRQAKIAEIADLEKKMKEKAKQLQDVALYQILAEKSPEMKDMLDRYTELTK